MQNLKSFKNFHINFAIFPMVFFKFYGIFGENLGKNLENLEISICRGFRAGAEPPDTSEFMQIWLEKSMETSNFWIVRMEILPFFKIFKECYRIFRENCAKDLGKYGHMVRSRSPPNLENFKNSSSKIQWKPPIFWKISRILREPFISNANFN